MVEKSQFNLADRPSMRFLTNSSTYDINMIANVEITCSVIPAWVHTNPNPNPNPSLTLTLT